MTARSPTSPPGACAARISSPRIFVSGRRVARLDLGVRETEPVKLAVQLVRAHDGAVLRRWRLGGVQPGGTRTLVWDGRFEGSVPQLGRYRFRVLPDGGLLEGTMTGALVERAFALYDHKFPVRGPHGFGSSGAHFGGGRGHQGQDVFAQCGTPVRPPAAEP